MRVAFELFGVSVSFYGIGAACSAALFFALLRRNMPRGGGLDAVTLALWVLPLAFVCARLFFCLARFEFVFLEMGVLFALSPWEGGFLMWGALAGAALGAAFACGRRKADPAGTFDVMAVPAMAAIALLRLFEYCTVTPEGAEGLGLILDEGSFFCRFPFALQNSYGDWQLAVFVWEAAAALVILALLLRHKGVGGDKALLMLVAYGAAQIVFESLRQDSSPKWGFVRISQVLGAVALFGAGAARLRGRLGTRSALIRAPFILACVAAVGILEWALDKTPLPIWACYALMCAAVGAAVLSASPRAVTEKRRP